MIGSEIEHLITTLSRLPGLGPRSARRAVLYLMRQPEKRLEPLIIALTKTQETITICTKCGSIDTTNPCRICTDTRRDQTILCIVEDMGDVWALERANAITGCYHVLGGFLSALDGVGPDELNLSTLYERCAATHIQEVILAMNATIEGQSTAHYIMDILDNLDISISRLAQGIPIGSELHYLDDGTLATAVKSRRKIAHADKKNNENIP